MQRSFEVPNLNKSTFCIKCHASDNEMAEKKNVDWFNANANESIIIIIKQPTVVIS